MDLHLTTNDLTVVEKVIQRDPSVVITSPVLVGHMVASKLHRLQEDDVSLADATTDMNDVAQKHNLDNIADPTALMRPIMLLGPLLAIHKVRTRVKELKVLCVGPRTEAELYNLVGYGFDPDNITAVDIIKITPAVELGDMHDLKYEDNTFDVIILGWVLAYSADNQKAANELLRVAKPGAYFAVGCACESMKEWHMDQERVDAAVGGIRITSGSNRFGTKTVSRYFSVGQINRLFEDHVDMVHFTEDRHPDLPDERSNVISIFRIK